MGRVVLVGQVVVDLVLAVPDLPRPGSDVSASDAVTTVGGGATLLRAAVSEGAEAVYAGAHGTGPWGDLVRAALAGLGIGVLQPASSGADTGCCVVLVDPSGERSMVSTSGAESHLDDGALARVDLGDDDVVCVSGYVLAAECGAAVGRWLAGLPAPVRVLVDPGPRVGELPGGILDPVLRRADWWSCNEAEAYALTGVPDATGSAIALLDRAAATGVVVRAGPSGCVLATRDREPVRIPAPVVTAVDTTGAGDTFTGVFAAGLAQDRPDGSSARRATVAAARAVIVRGPGPG